MDVRLLDLDGSLLPQRRLRELGPDIVHAHSWGPRLRLACSPRRFRRFQRFLAGQLGCLFDDRPKLTLYGSGDFHHVSLALLQRIPGACNLLIVDKHPDWMAGLPFLHCGSWVAHALRLDRVQRVFHVGGDCDFDNRYRWLAPWQHLRDRRIVLFPALRRFARGAWASICHEPLRDQPDQELQPAHLHKLLEPYREDLARLPLYVSVDKDVLSSEDAVVSWDSGHLRLAEVEAVLEAFIHAAQGQVAGVDLVGDWSPVKVRGWFRRFLHLVEHDPLAVDPAHATRRNEATNLALIAGCAYARRLGSVLGQPQEARSSELLPT
jgi:hypothetical protein